MRSVDMSAAMHCMKTRICKKIPRVENMVNRESASMQEQVKDGNPDRYSGSERSFFFFDSD